LRLLLVAGATHDDAAQAVAADLAHGAEREVESPAASEGAAVQHRQRIFLPFSSLVTTEMAPNASVRCAQETPLALKRLPLLRDGLAPEVAAASSVSTLAPARRRCGGIAPSWKPE
jgi:hypothetical protein